MTSAPFGAPEIVAAVAGAERILDVGCGSGRLTVALAGAGAAVTGIDTSAGQLEVARERAAAAAVELTLLAADFNGPLPFADASFDAVTSRLALMAADDPVATLTEVRRVLEPGGRIVTVLWAAPAENPWFAVPRQVVATVLGAERASFARAFGRLGEPEEAAEVHRAAGLSEVAAVRLHGLRTAESPGHYWNTLTEEIGHFGRIAAAVDEGERQALADELEAALEPFRDGDRIALPRTLVLVTASR